MQLLVVGINVTHVHTLARDIITSMGSDFEFIANKRLRAIGLDAMYDISSSYNPLPWTQHWFNSKGLQNAPQETEIESYVIGGIKQDVSDDTFTDFKL